MKLYRDGRLVKSSDISDEEFISCLEPDGRWTMSFDVMERLSKPYPYKVVVAKAKTLISRRKILHGCDCGCRGDWHLASECKSPGNC